MLALPLLAWAAYTDWQVRRVATAAWVGLILLGALAGIWEIALLAPIDGPTEQSMMHLFTAVPVVSGVLGVALYEARLFGSADTKSLLALALLFPTSLTYSVAGQTLPLIANPLGSLFVAIVASGLLVAMYYPLTMWITNLRRGERSRVALVSTEVRTDAVSSAVGQLRSDDVADTDDSYRVVDLDTLRMYARWRQLDLDTLETRGVDYRDPMSVTQTYHVHSGAIRPRHQLVPGIPLPVGTHSEGVNEYVMADGGEPEDPWGAERFLVEIDHDAYGDSAADITAGLDALVTRRRFGSSPLFPCWWRSWSASCWRSPSETSSAGGRCLPSGK